jgi:hypothetical protein
MPIYTLEGPDGKKYRIEGPAGATAEQLAGVIQGQSAQPTQEAPAPKASFGDQLKREIYTSAPFALARGVKDVIDTGAQGAAWLSDKITGGDASQQVKAENEAGKQDFAETTKGSYVAPVARVVGNVIGTAPVTSAIGAGASAAGLNRLGQALSTGGASIGKTTGNRLADVLLKSGAGAATGYTAAGLVDPDSAGMGAAIGGAVPLVGPALQGLGSAARKMLGGTTGVGDEALAQAYKAGKTGGQAAADFTQNMRGGGSMDDVLTAAKQNLDAMGQQKQAAYRSGMANIKADKSVLSFQGIDDAIDNARELTSFKGQSKNAKASQAVQAAADEIQKWKQLDPAEFHTPEGLDALKQRLNGVLESIPFEEKTARKAVGNIYSSIKSEISKQAPEYSKVMSEYSTASETIKEIEKALSLGNKAAADTSMRKLQSLMRNNVNTSYGYRDTLAKTMIDAGGNDIMPALAGQAMNDWTPRGIQRATAGAGSGLLALTGNLPAAAGMAAISSPRVAGEVMYGAGRLAGKVPSNALTEALRQGVYRGAPIAGTQ